MVSPWELGGQRGVAPPLPFLGFYYLSVLSSNQEIKVRSI